MVPKTRDGAQQEEAVSRFDSMTDAEIRDEAVLRTLNDSPQCARAGSEYLRGHGRKASLARLRKAMLVERIGYGDLAWWRVTAAGEALLEELDKP